MYWFCSSSARLSTPPASPTNDQALPIDDLTAPFNQFHLRRPAPKTCKLSKKQRHTLNLSVAAGGVAKPVLRPARLRGLRNFTLLHPPRLSTSACEASSTLNQAVVSQLQKNTFLPLAQLCDERSDNADCSQNKLFGACLSSDCGSKESELSFKSIKGVKTKLSVLSSKNASFASSSSSPNQLFANNLSLSSHHSPSPAVATSDPPHQASAISDPRHQASAPPSQSCRQQLQRREDGSRLEDTTPAELASYLDLLLHLPKDMSPMAQAMYAWPTGCWVWNTLGWFG